jgi:CHAT domain-containing protein
LPLHAAGIFEGMSQDHLADYVISSYTPTVTALYRLLGEAQISTASTKVLLVAQPTSIGLSSLMNVATEVDLIRSLVPPEHTTSLGDGKGSSVQEALDAMRSANVLHLACHGHQDQRNPLDCGFELQDGRLTLGQLMKLNIPDSQLAYLSACDSAGMDESRPDEGLNLVGAMIFVGFQSVIGTMW